MGLGLVGPSRKGPGELTGEWAPNEMSESLSDGAGLKGGLRSPP